MPKLKPGDFVYRVREYDHPDDRPHTWQVAKIEVKSASDRMIILARMDPALGHRTRFEPKALGWLFFATFEEAIEAFVKQQQREISTANGTIITASRAIAWARENGFKDAG